MQIAAAHREYFLEVYTGETDQDGFDIIFDDRDVLRKFQVKTVISDSTTSCWGVHKTILRPLPEHAEKLEFEPSPEGSGTEGGVILMEVNCDNPDLKVDYYYTDVFILRAFDLNVIKVPKSFKSFYHKLQRGKSHDKIKVRKNILLNAKSPAHLLALAGLHSTVCTNLHHLIMNCNDPKKLGIDSLNCKEIISKLIKEELEKLCK
jgi:hypothetical protein